MFRPRQAGRTRRLAAPVSFELASRIWRVFSQREFRKAMEIVICAPKEPHQSPLDHVNARPRFPSQVQNGGRQLARQVEHHKGKGLPALRGGDVYAVDDIDDHPLTQDASVREAIRKLGVRAFLEVPLVRGGELRGWLYVNRTRPHRWSKHEIALVSETLERSWETLERARSEERLREQEVRLKAVLEQMPVGVILASIPDGGLSLYNKRSAEIMGHDMLGHDLSDYGAYGGVHEDGSPFRAEEYPTARAVVGGETIVGERIRYRRPDGSVAHLSVSAAPIRTPYGDFAVCSFEDQTELHKALEREQLLNAELQHRVKNLLATVQAIASQTVGSAEERAAFEGRLQALAPPRTCWPSPVGRACSRISWRGRLNHSRNRRGSLHRGPP